MRAVLERLHVLEVTIETPAFPRKAKGEVCPEHLLRMPRQLARICKLY